jgi:hypothetical protein
MRVSADVPRPLMKAERDSYPLALFATHKKAGHLPGVRSRGASADLRDYTLGDLLPTPPLLSVLCSNLGLCRHRRYTGH